MHLVKRTISTAVRASAAAGFSMLLASAARGRAPWSGINAMTCALLRGRRGRIPTAFAPKHTLLGAAILVGGLGVMSAVYEGVLHRGPQRRGPLSGGLFALAGYAIDRWLLPRRLLEEFEGRMGRLGTLVKYAALALAAGTGGQRAKDA